MSSSKCCSFVPVSRLPSVSPTSPTGPPLTGNCGAKASLVNCCGKSTVGTIRTAGNTQLRVPQLRYQPICKSQRTSARLFEAGEFVRGPSTERGMRPDGVVVLAPGREDQACLIQALEPVQIQTLVPDTAVETLDVSVLDGLPRPDEGVRDATPMGPEIQALARELWAIVGGDRLRCPRKRTTASRARTTSCPVMEVPTCITRHSRVKSSTTFRTRNRCPEASWSDMKSRLHR